jgi:hypothetical protein
VCGRIAAVESMARTDAFDSDVRVFVLENHNTNRISDTLTDTFMNETISRDMRGEIFVKEGKK